MYLAAILFFFIPGRLRGLVAAILTLKATIFGEMSRSHKERGSDHSH